MKKILLFGASGGLGSTICKLLKNKNNFLVKSFKKNKLNFDTKNLSFKIEKILKKENPDYIINCAGIFGTNKIKFEKIFNINLKSNWDIANFYLKKKDKIKKKILIYFIGSSSFNSPRKNYILYTATKSALNNMYKSLKENFKNTLIKIKIINPPAMKTKMRKKFKILTGSKNLKAIEPKIIAKAILLDLK